MRRPLWLAKAHCRDHQYGYHDRNKDSACDRVATGDGLTWLANHGEANYRGEHVPARQQIQRDGHSLECRGPGRGRAATVRRCVRFRVVASVAAVWPA